jgi:hypothetical protein
MHERQHESKENACRDLECKLLFFFPFTRVFSLILHSKQSISNPNNHNQLVVIFKLSLVQKKINKSMQHVL